MNTFAQSTTPATDDPYASAMEQQSQERVYFGEVSIVDVYHVTLEKGVGKRSFDPTRDPIDKRNTNIKMQIECAKRDGSTYTVDQETLDWAKEWQKFTLPSLRQNNADLRTLRGRYVQVKRVFTGEFYTNKAGDKKDRTAIVFERFFDSADACQAAADAFYKRPGVAEPTAPAQSTPAAPQPDTSAQERAFAVQALPMLWQASGENKDQFLTLIAGNPMIAKHFNANSDEVLQTMGLIPF